MGDLIECLPETSDVHWTPHHKAAVLLALRTGEVKRFEAYQRYDLSAEELREWEAGLTVCRTTKRDSP